jgi:Cu2+-exporting ATPase
MASVPTASRGSLASWRCCRPSMTIFQRPHRPCRHDLAAPALDDPLEFDAASRASRCGCAGQGRQLRVLACSCRRHVLRGLRRHDRTALQASTACWRPASVRPRSAPAVRWDRSAHPPRPDRAPCSRRLRRRARCRGARARPCAEASTGGAVALFVASFCAMQVMMLATPSYVAAPANWRPTCGSCSTGGLGADAAGDVVCRRALLPRRLARPAAAAHRHGRAGGAGHRRHLRRQHGCHLRPGGVFGHEVYFDSLTMFVSFLLAGASGTARAPSRGRGAGGGAGAHARHRPARPRTTAAGRRSACAACDPATVVRCRGQAFPADGVLLEGRTQADEALLTGESTPVPKRGRREVVAGSINVGAPVVMQVSGSAPTRATRPSWR